MKIYEEASFLWIQHFERRCICKPTCLVMQESQSDKLCGLCQIAVSWAIWLSVW